MFSGALKYQQILDANVFDGHRFGFLSYKLVRQNSPYELVLKYVQYILRSSQITAIIYKTSAQPKQPLSQLWATTYKDYDRTSDFEAKSIYIQLNNVVFQLLQQNNLLISTSLITEKMLQQLFLMVKKNYKPLIVQRELQANQRWIMSCINLGCMLRSMAF